MKVLAALILVVIMHMGTLAFAQKITLQLQDQSLETVFKEVRKQSRYDFLYNEALLRNLKPVSVNVKNASIAQVLDSVFMALPLSYTIEDKVVMITGRDIVVQLRASYSISGIIKDQQGNVLPGAGILLSGYKIGAVAGNDGRFVMKGLSPGNYNLLIDMIGYLPESNNILISNSSADVEVILKESVKMLKEVIISPDPHRAKRLKVFKDTFIGTSPNANACKILNPEVIQLDYDNVNRVLRVKSEEFIVIENKALGYRIKYLLNYYEKDEDNNVVVFYGYPYFEEIEQNLKKRKRYMKKRQEAYVGSPQHFLWALYHSRSKEEGFIVNDLIKSPNNIKLSAVMRKDYDLINEHVRIKGNSWTKKDFVNYWSLMNKESDTLEVLVRKEIPDDSLVKNTGGPLKTIHIKEALYVTFMGEKEGKRYTKSSGFSIKRPKDIAPYQVSLVYPLRSFIGFYENGGLYDPASLLFEGVWAYEKVADMVPMDYILQK